MVTSMIVEQKSPGIAPGDSFYAPVNVNSCSCPPSDRATVVGSMS